MRELEEPETGVEADEQGLAVYIIWALGEVKFCERWEKKLIFQVAWWML